MYFQDLCPALRGKLCESRDHIYSVHFSLFSA